VAKLARKDLEKIIARDAPGYRIIDRPTHVDSVRRLDRPDAVSADVDTIRRRYGVSAPSNATARAARAAGTKQPTEQPEDEIVVLEPKGATAADAAQGPGPKVVVVSGAKQRIIGRQG